MFPNLFRIYFKLITIITIKRTCNSQSLRTPIGPIGKSKVIYTFTYFGSLAWNYISSKIPTDVSYICFKNIAKLHLQSNNLPQIRLNV